MNGVYLLGIYEELDQLLQCEEKRRGGTTAATVTYQLASQVKTMEIDDFWAIVDVGKDSEEPEVAVHAELLRHKPDEIVAYQRHFDRLVVKAYRWDLWGAAYISEGGCSDDGFIDFRYALISRGRDVYERALEDPDSIVDADVASNEDFGYIASDAYEELTGEEMPRDDIEWPDEPIGEEWDFDLASENERRLPRLWARFGELLGD